jgi:hypothetical protein
LTGFDLHKIFIQAVFLLLIFAGGNDYKDWAPFKVPTDKIIAGIDKAEKSGAGRFFNDDTFFYLPELDCEILFCHECDDLRLAIK